MPTFNADWLALREPADHVARSARLTEALAAFFGGERVIQALDLGSGSGSNVRYLAPRLRGPQQWLLIDNDAALLAQVPATMAAWAREHGYIITPHNARWRIDGPAMRCELQTRRADLDTVLDNNIVPAQGLATTSALLDLVSADWLRALVKACRNTRAAALFALTYSGTIRCAPEEPEDRAIESYVNRHQRRDKGLGPAAGPDAAAIARTEFETAGYRVDEDASNWVVAPDARELQRQLIRGWATTAVEVDPTQAAMVGSWQSRRLAHVEADQSTVRVGHTDLIAWLP